MCVYSNNNNNKLRSKIFQLNLILLFYVYPANTFVWSKNAKLIINLHFLFIYKRVSTNAHINIYGKRLCSCSALFLLSCLTSLLFFTLLFCFIVELTRTYKHLYTFFTYKYASNEQVNIMFNKIRVKFYSLHCHITS